MTKFGYSRDYVSRFSIWIGSSGTRAPVAGIVAAASVDATPVRPISPAPRAVFVENQVGIIEKDAIHLRNISIHRDNIIREVVVDGMTAARVVHDNVD